MGEGGKDGRGATYWRGSGGRNLEASRPEDVRAAWRPSTARSWPNRPAVTQGIGGEAPQGRGLPTLERADPESHATCRFSEGPKQFAEVVAVAQEGGAGRAHLAQGRAGWQQHQRPSRLAPAPARTGGPGPMAASLRRRLADSLAEDGG